MESGYGKILSVNLRHNFLLPFVSAAGVFVLTLLLFNVTSLHGEDAARPFEFLLSWMGVMLLVPIFLPEQNKDIRDVIRSKKIDYLKICVIRVLYSVAALVGLESLFVGIMRWRESTVTLAQWFGGITAALFLGAVGLAAAGMSDNTTVGYMAAMIYYLANYGLKDKLGYFYLFSMSAGEYEGKGFMLIGAISLMALGVFGTVFVVFQKGR